METTAHTASSSSSAPHPAGATSSGASSSSTDPFQLKVIEQSITELQSIFFTLGKIKLGEKTGFDYYLRARSPVPQPIASARDAARTVGKALTTNRVTVAAGTVLARYVPALHTLKKVGSCIKAEGACRRLRRDTADNTIIFLDEIAHRVQQTALAAQTFTDHVKVRPPTHIKIDEKHLPSLTLIFRGFKELRREWPAVQKGLKSLTITYQATPADAAAFDKWEGIKQSVLTFTNTVPVALTHVIGEISKLVPELEVADDHELDLELDPAEDEFEDGGSAPSSHVATPSGEHKEGKGVAAISRSEAAEGKDEDDIDFGTEEDFDIRSGWLAVSATYYYHCCKLCTKIEILLKSLARLKGNKAKISYADGEFSPTIGEEATSKLAEGSKSEWRLISYFSSLGKMVAEPVTRFVTNDSLESNLRQLGKERQQVEDFARICIHHMNTNFTPQERLDMLARITTLINSILPEVESGLNDFAAIYQEGAGTESSTRAGSSTEGPLETGRLNRGSLVKRKTREFLTVVRTALNSILLSQRKVPPTAPSEATTTMPTSTATATAATASSAATSMPLRSSSHSSSIGEHKRSTTNTGDNRDEA